MLLAGLAMLAGCADRSRLVDPQAGRVRADDRVFLVQGVSGALVLGMDTLREGLKDAGVPADVEAIKWHASRPPFLVVLDDHEYEFIEAGADDLANKIEAWLRAHPAGRVHVIAQSAGTEVTRRALELLHPNAQVETVVFLGCAMGDRRRLTDALHAVHGKLYNIHSGNDWFLLAFGAALTGTSDRAWSFAAGFGGFRLPPDATDADRHWYERKLVQIDWDGRLAEFGHDGSHVGGMAYTFTRYYLSHLIAGLGPPAGQVRAGASP